MGRAQQRYIGVSIAAGVAATTTIFLVGFHKGSVSAQSVEMGRLEPFYSQQLDWASCANLGYDGKIIDETIDNVQCTRVTVPLDYSKPDGKTAQVALSRVLASGDKIGSLVMNPGGPGASGLDMVTLGEGTSIAEKFDRVGFDPRGTGSSLPVVQCSTAAEFDAARLEFDPDLTLEGTNDKIRKDVARCGELSGLDLLANVGTRDVVRDLDIVRAVLGDDKLTYLGESYGTAIGSQYAEAFPDRVRAMVLDGAINPSEPLLAGIDEGFSTAFDDYAAECAKAADCPVGTDPAVARQALDALFEPLITTPARTSDGRGLSYTDAQQGYGLFLYSSETWDVLTRALKQISNGRGDIMLEAADFVYARRPDGTYGNRQEIILAVRCVDSPPAPAAAPDAPIDPCTIWPVPPTGAPHEITVQGLPELVVVSTTKDPATPHEDGIELARQLDASLITYEAEQHGVALRYGVDCVDEPVIDYLTDLTAPAENLVCR
ncbi:alpha/beta fold hydrolase [Antrihabitans sp. YC3-6]|uniref:Alpha/beta fold hydrolase n=1 Tax=Antrihabitans stalagmiti TaxID=2799499 RepID=A0A934NMY3_9NOCA|nr:alpha/beta hydrolase [Antrihabitans stalagmiti]MBJ8338183.1 alpha/beta fold hydrolase [Antrihabitans stalagmiti]